MGVIAIRRADNGEKLKLLERCPRCRTSSNNSSAWWRFGVASRANFT
jgi:hypothetical protein